MMNRARLGLLGLAISIALVACSSDSSEGVLVESSGESSDGGGAEKGALVGSCAYSDPHFCQEFWGTTDGPSTCSELKGQWTPGKTCSTSGAVGSCDMGAFVFVFYSDYLNGDVENMKNKACMGGTWTDISSGSDAGVDSNTKD